MNEIKAIVPYVEMFQVIQIKDKCSLRKYMEILEERRKKNIKFSNTWVMFAVGTMEHDHAITSYLMLKACTYDEGTINQLIKPLSDVIRGSGLPAEFFMRLNCHLDILTPIERSKSYGIGKIRNFNNRFYQHTLIEFVKNGTNVATLKNLLFGLGPINSSTKFALKIAEQIKKKAFAKVLRGYRQRHRDDPSFTACDSENWIKAYPKTPKSWQPSVVPADVRRDYIKLVEYYTRQKFPNPEQVNDIAVEDLQRMIHQIEPIARPVSDLEPEPLG
jgi:hypothetical protein